MADRKPLPWITCDQDGDVFVYLWAKPGSKASRIGPIDPWRGVLIVAVEAQPQRGAANEAVRALIAAAVGVKLAQVELVGGATSTRKTLRIAGSTLEHVRAGLGGKP